MLRESDLHGYQHTGVDWILENPKAGLFLDMGLGKTVTTLTATQKLMFALFEVTKTLIVAPKRVAENVWTSELHKWEHLKGLKISRIIGSEKQRRAALAEKADIYTVSRDNVVWLCGLFGGSMLPFDMLIIDESSSFKSHKSLRFKALRAVMPSINRVVLLTGTPAPNGLEDLWSQVYLLDRGERLGKTITKYRDEYFKPGQRNGAIVYNYDPVKDGEERIHKKIEDICMSMKKEDYLDLPGVVMNMVEVKFPPELQKKYNDFEKEQVLRLFSATEDDKEISALNGAALSNKLLQFANGAIYDEDREVHEMHTLKLEAAEELVEAACGKPVLIAWTYQHDRDRLKIKLAKYKPRELKTEKDITDWNAGKIQVLLMHPASGGHGLNLQQGGNIIVWFGQTWSLELYQQLNARLDRQGKTEITIIHHLISSNTIDLEVVKSLEGKDAKQEALMQAVKARIKKYLK